MKATLWYSKRHTLNQLNEDLKQIVGLVAVNRIMIGSEQIRVDIEIKD